MRAGAPCVSNRSALGTFGLQQNQPGGPDEDPSTSRICRRRERGGRARLEHRRKCASSLSFALPVVIPDGTRGRAVWNAGTRTIILNATVSALKPELSSPCSQSLADGLWGLARAKMATCEYGS
jgi:hypothetical protein